MEENRQNTDNLNNKISIRISPKTRERLEREAGRIGIRMSNYIRMILEGRKYRTRVSEDDSGYRSETERKLMEQYEQIKGSYAQTMKILNEIRSEKLSDGSAAVNTDVVTRAVNSLERATIDYVEQYKIFNTSRGIASTAKENNS